MMAAAAATEGLAIERFQGDWNRDNMATAVAIVAASGACSEGASSQFDTEFHKVHTVFHILLRFARNAPGCLSLEERNLISQRNSVGTL